MINRGDGRLTFIPGEVPTLQLGLIDLEESCSGNRFSTFLSNGEGEVGVWLADTSLGAIDGRVNFKTDIEELTSEEINPFQRMM